LGYVRVGARHEYKQRAWVYLNSRPKDTGDTFKTCGRIYLEGLSLPRFPSRLLHPSIDLANRIVWISFQPTMTDLPMTFATALNCMDGRVQIPVNQKVRQLFDVTYVDTITEAGIVRFLSDQTDSAQTEAALQSVAVSIERHGSKHIAVAAHHDCAGNPLSEQQQKQQLRQAVAFLRDRFEQCEVVALWVDAAQMAHVVIPPAGD